MQYSARQFGRRSISKTFFFCEFLTQFDPISGRLIAFLHAAAEINNKDTVKVCSKIMKIADLDLGFFLDDGTNPRMKFPAELQTLSV